jgi:hypothetical protein
MKAVGHFVFGAVRDIRVSVDLLAAQADLAAGRISAVGVRKDNGESIRWVENHIYRLQDGRIKDWWPSGAFLSAEPRRADRPPAQPLSSGLPDWPLRAGQLAGGSSNRTSRSPAWTGALALSP